MTAVAIPVRPGEPNLELRFALRSIAAYVRDPQVWIVGYRPTWVHGVEWLPTLPYGEKPDRGCQQAAAWATCDDAPQEGWWWDDDMFRLTPLRGAEVLHGGSLRDWWRRYDRVDSVYARVLRRTAGRVGLDKLMYDLHVPMWIPNRRDLADTLAGLPVGVGGWLWRTVHGNRMHLGGYGHPDVKVYAGQPIPDPPGRWLSCDDASFHRLLPLLRERFPDPSPWEGPTGPPTRIRASYTRSNGETRVVSWAASVDAVFRQSGWQLTSVFAEAVSPHAPVEEEPAHVGLGHVDTGLVTRQ